MMTLKSRRFSLSHILGRPFPGYEDIDLSFEEIETLVRNCRPDWKAALRVKGRLLQVQGGIYHHLTSPHGSGETIYLAPRTARAVSGRDGAPMRERAWR